MRDGGVGEPEWGFDFGGFEDGFAGEAGPFIFGGPQGEGACGDEAEALGDAAGAEGEPEAVEVAAGGEGEGDGFDVGGPGLVGVRFGFRSSG